VFAWKFPQWRKRRESEFSFERPLGNRLLNS
jgi:hypothetical protein